MSLSRDRTSGTLNTRNSISQETVFKIKPKLLFGGKSQNQKMIKIQEISLISNIKLK